MDKNLVTVISGQAVEAFDRLFRTLYATSTSVNLKRVVSEPEPEPDPLPQAVTLVVPSDTVARKLFSPKYALAFGGTSASSIPAPSADHITPKKTGSEQNPGNPEGQAPQKKGRRKASKEPVQEAPPLHPGLCNLEKAHLISYLPIWPEPDPPKDVIGFINIRDTNKPSPVHLQRSEMFEVSQAIRFKSPVSVPMDTLPDVPQPSQFTTAKNLQQDKTGQSLPDTRFGNTKSVTKEPERELNGPALKCQSVKSSIDTDELQSNTTSSQNANPSSGSLLNEHSSSQSVPVTPTIDLVKDQTEERASSSSEDTQMHLPPKDSQPQVDHRRNLSGLAQSTDNVDTKTTRTPLRKTTVNSPPLASVSLTSLTVNAAMAADRNTGTATSSFSPQRSLSSTNLAPNHPPSSSQSSLSLTSAPPVPKPRTIQLFIEDSTISEGQRQLERFTMSGVSLTNSVASEDHSSEKELEMLSGQQSKIGSKDNVSLKTSVEALKPKESSSLKEPQVTEGLKSNQDSLPGVDIADTAKTQDISLSAKSPKDNRDTLTPIDCKAAARSVQIESKSNEFPKTIPQNNQPAAQHKTFFLSAQNPQRILYSSSTSTKADESSSLTSSKSSKSTPGLAVDMNKQARTEHAKENSQFPATRKADGGKNTTNVQLGTKAHETSSAHNPEKWAAAQILAKQKEVGKETRQLSTVTTPGSLPQTPGQRPFTPDLRTRTSAISDGYISALSTASDEFYECSDSPLHDNVFDPHDGAKDGSTNSPNSTTKNLSNVQNNTTKTVQRPASGSSSSTLLGEKDQKKAFEINHKMWREMDAISLKTKAPDRRAEVDVRKSQMSLDNLKQVKALAESKSMEAQLRGSMRRRLLSESKADKGGVFGEKTEPKKSTGDPRLRRTPSVGDKLDRVLWRPSSLETKARSPTARDGQKVRRELQQASFRPKYLFGSVCECACQGLLKMHRRSITKSKHTTLVHY